MSSTPLKVTVPPATRSVLVLVGTQLMPLRSTVVLLSPRRVTLTPAPLVLPSLRCELPEANRLSEVSPLPMTVSLPEVRVT